MAGDVNGFKKSFKYFMICAILLIFINLACVSAYDLNESADEYFLEISDISIKTNGCGEVIAQKNVNDVLNTQHSFFKWRLF